MKTTTKKGCINYSDCKKGLFLACWMGFVREFEVEIVMRDGLDMSVFTWCHRLEIQRQKWPFGVAADTLWWSCIAVDKKDRRMGVDYSWEKTGVRGWGRGVWQCEYHAKHTQAVHMTKQREEKSHGYVRRHKIGTVRICHRSHHFATQSSHFVDRAGWQAKMASIEFWIPWRNVHDTHWTQSDCFNQQDLINAVLEM